MAASKTKTSPMIFPGSRRRSTKTSPAARTASRRRSFRIRSRYSSSSSPNSANVSLSTDFEAGASSRNISEHRMPTEALHCCRGGEDGNPHFVSYNLALLLISAILSLYLSYKLGYDKDLATVIYHVFIMLCYFFPFLGAILADSWLGKFRTIFCLSVVYALGNVVVSVAAIPDVIPPKIFTAVGLVLITLGTGGIKPCVAAFGGDQFVLPQQEDQLQKFFSLFYFAINSGSLLSTFITPILREDVKCFNEDSCYSLAFGVPAVLMVTALVIFTSGKRWYKIKKPEGNIIVKVGKCIWYAARKKNVEKREHWLYKADDRYDRKFIQDVIAALRVLVLYIPLPIFWALFDQQGSRWTFQATRMDVDVGGIKIKPDQMQVVNPVLILLFIPIFESVVYPVLAKCNLLTKPLQRITVGGLLAAAAFGISAIVEIQLEKTYPILPVPGEGQFRAYSALPTDLPLTVKTEDEELPGAVLQSMNKMEYLHIKAKNKTRLTLIGGNEIFQVDIFEEKATAGIFVGEKIESLKFFQFVHENVDKSSEGDPKLMVILSDPLLNDRIGFVNFTTGGTEISFNFTAEKPFTDLQKIPTDEYAIKYGNHDLGRVYLKQGGIYVLIAAWRDDRFATELLTMADPNSVCILWLIPQYAVITAGEVMFSITGLEFSFTQAPISMKSLMQAVWLLTTAVGNMVVVIVAKAKIFSRQTYEFILFGGLMLVDMIIFALMAMRYTYVENVNDQESDEVELDSAKSKGAE